MELADLDVLVVDDHEAMRALLSRVLTRMGVTRLRTLASATHALASLREQPATLILADTNMPGMDGLSFLAAVRSEGAFGAPQKSSSSAATPAARMLTRRGRRARMQCL